MNRTLTIDRSKWRCGGDGDDLQEKFGLTSLRDSLNGMQCCLGFDALSCGLTESHINNIGSPVGLKLMRVASNILALRIPHLLDDNNNSSFAQKAMKINDSYDISNKKRESKLIKHYATIGVKVEFIGEYPREEV